jgi:hypothetical protein
MGRVIMAKVKDMSLKMTELGVSRLVWVVQVV